MNNLQNEISFQCPYCGTQLTFTIDPTGGRRQSFITDCEICCHPIVVKAQIDESGDVDVDVERE